MKKINIVIIGLGPHTRRIYYPLLEKYYKQKKLNISLLIDLEDQFQIINEYLKRSKLKIDETLFLNNKYRNNKHLCTETLSKLKELKKRDWLIR